MEKNFSSKFWNNGWVIGTGTAILSVLLLRIIDAVAKTNILNSVWIFFKNILLAIGIFFNRSFSMPLWGLILLSFSGLALFILTLWIESLFKKSNEIVKDTPLFPAFFSYKSEVFDGVLYKWEYLSSRADSKKYTISNFVPFCPKDNCILFDGQCQICKNNFRMKSEIELMILVQHRIDNNLYSR